MNNNLLRCDLSQSQLDALAESKGQWILIDECYEVEDSDLLLRDWNGFQFFKWNDLFVDDIPFCIPLYCTTPGGYFLAAIATEENEPEPDENGNIGYSEELLLEWVEDAIATLLSLPEQQGQLCLELGV